MNPSSPAKIRNICKLKKKMSSIVSNLLVNDEEVSIGIEPSKPSPKSHFNRTTKLTMFSAFLMISAAVSAVLVVELSNHGKEV